jgi:hypothetical protein
MLANNETVMKEMEKRGEPPRTFKVAAMIYALRCRALNQFSTIEHVLNEKHDSLSVPSHIYGSATVKGASYDSHDCIFGNSHGGLGTESFSLQAVGLAKSHFGVLRFYQEGKRSALRFRLRRGSRIEVPLAYHGSRAPGPFKTFQIVSLGIISPARTAARGGASFATARCTSSLRRQPVKVGHVHPSNEPFSSTAISEPAQDLGN